MLHPRPRSTQEREAEEALIAALFEEQEQEVEGNGRLSAATRQTKGKAEAALEA